MPKSNGEPLCLNLTTIACLLKKHGLALLESMRKPVVIRPEAGKEAAAAIECYAERSEAVAKRFAEALLQTADAIAADPKRFPVYKAKYRYRLLSRFPYRVIYQERDEDIEILAVAHTSRRPDYWIGR
jgi:toxin ParE1/3/4